MAIYYLDAKVISRSTGRSAVASAAYRSGEILFDERYEKEHDYSRKQNIAYTEILLPIGAPLELKDREKLWNEVERSEKRKDAQLARELVIALPKELTVSQNVELIKDYVQSHFVDKGMIADICVHNDKAIDGEPQPHAHVLLTMRELNLEGGDKGKEEIREMCFGKKVREWNLKENLLLWRESWAQHANRHLSLNGHDRRIDHRRLEEQGIELTPGVKVGASAAREHMARLIEQQKISFENGEKIYKNPEIALNALTRQQSTFTHHDLAKFVNRHSVDAAQFERVYEKVRHSEQLVNLGKDGLGRDRYTTIEMLHIEKRMLERSHVLSQRAGHGILESCYEKGIKSRDLSIEQQNAYRHLLAEKDLRCVVGLAGSGKSYLLGAVKEAWETQGYCVMGASLSGIAAENLQDSSGIASRTIASYMYYWERGERLLTHKDILVIDEAGMIGSRQMEQLLKHVEERGAKCVLIGDPQQLQAIEAGAAFRAIVQQLGFIELTEIRRQQHEWQRVATKEFARGNIEEGIIEYKRHENIHEFETKLQAKKAMVELWNDARITHREETQIMLSYTRKDVQELNTMAREMRQELGELGESHVLTTAKGHKEFAQNDRIYFLKNDRDLGVKNGSLGTIEKIENNVLTVKLDKEDKDNRDTVSSFMSSQVIVDLDKYNHIDHGYAATIHKAQGVTVDRTYLLASKYMDSHATYVGLSRHRQSADLFYAIDEFNNERNLHYILGRERAKDVSIDYGHEKIRDEFASCRDIEVIKVSKSLAKQVERSSLIDIDSVGINEKAKGLERGAEKIEGVEKAEKQIQRGEEDRIAKGMEKEIKIGIENQSQRENKDLDKAIKLDKEQVDKEPDSDFSKIADEQRQKDWEELMKFKKDYESKHPEVAKGLAEEMQPEGERSEKRVVAVEKEIRQLKETIKKDPLAMLAKKELNALILKVTKDKELMQELKERAPALTAQIVIKAKELSRDRNLCRSR